MEFNYCPRNQGEEPEAAEEAESPTVSAPNIENRKADAAIAFALDIGLLAPALSGDDAARASAARTLDDALRRYDLAIVGRI